MLRELALSISKWLRHQNEVRGMNICGNHAAASYTSMSYTPMSYAAMSHTSLYKIGTPADRQLALFARSGFIPDVEAARSPNLLLFKPDDLLP